MVNTAVHLYNYTPVYCLEWRTPYKLLYHQVPSIGHLRVFGCGAYIHILAEARKDKLSPKSEFMIFLGYPEGVKGYLFMWLPNNILFKGTTAIFDEEMMPKCDKIIKRKFTPLGGKKPSKEDPSIPQEDNDNSEFPYHCRSPSPNKRDNAVEDNNQPQHSLPHTPPKQQEQLPPTQRQLLPLRCKPGHEWKIPVRPDNIYGNRQNSVEIQHEDRRCALGKEPEKIQQEIPLVPQRDESLVSGPGSPDARDSYHDVPLDITESQMARIAQEGGVDLINYLLAKAMYSR